MRSPGTPGELATGRRYLRQFDLYRVIAFLGVIGQHAVLWPIPGGSDVGWSLVMVLHATRESFFFLSAFVACYSQILSPRSLPGFWTRRIGAVLGPYLAWTAVYVAYTVVSSPAPVTIGPTVVHDLLNGYYQLYFLVVLFQVYIVLPGVLWVLRRTRGHHAWVFAVSLALQLTMMTLSHYFSWRTGPMHAVRAVDLNVITPRYVMGYQLYIVAGALAACHFDKVQGIVERHSARVLAAAGLAFCLAEGYYAYGLLAGESPGHASDLFQPVAAVWFLSACAGLWALGWRWARRAAQRPTTRADALVRWGADASGGFYLSHVLVLQLIFTGLADAGLTGARTWGAASAVLFVGTVCGAGLLVAVIMRTPLRWLLTGPDRSAARARAPVYPAAPKCESIAAPTASAIAR